MKWRLFPILTLILLLSLLPSACSSNKTGGSIIVASKQFTENVLLSEMYAQLIENHTDLEVIRKQKLGSTNICVTAMRNKEIDFYVDYTGTLYNEVLGYAYDPEISAEDLYEVVKTELPGTQNAAVFQTIGLNNTYALAMLNGKADTLGIKTMSDLSSAAPKLVFAANSLYYTRVNDGYDTMSEKYGLNFKSAVKMDSSLLFDAASDDQVDVIVVYATDSLLPKYDMVILEDDKQMFPDYYAIPVVRTDVLKAYPELNDVLDLLAHKINNESMQELNYLVDIENKSLAEVAKAFLKEQGLI